MLAYLRKHKRAVSFALLLIITQGIFSESAMALTSGPSQPETQQFAPAGMDNLVDPFTGDFSYNIPLMDVGGYPINLNYASGITPDAEASWVGLGWNVNVGAINRSMRGLPDDFQGDEVTKEYNTKPNQTFGVNGKITMEFYGAKLDKLLKALKSKKLSATGSIDLSYNTYNGFALKVGVSPSVNAGSNTKSKFTANLGINASLGSESGLELTPSVGLSHKQAEGDQETTLSSNISFPFNTREGLKGMTLSASATNTKGIEKNAAGDVTNSGNSFGVSGNAFQGFAGTTYTPSIEHNTYNVNASLNIDFAAGSTPAFDGFPVGFGGYYSGEFLKDVARTLPAYGYMYSGMSTSDDRLLDFNREKDGSFNEFTTNLAVTNFTYDVFQVSGQGVGGAYRLYRGDMGSVYDPITSSQGYTPGLGFELGAGAPPSGKLGVDASFNYSQSFSGPWPSYENSIKKFKNESRTSFQNPKKEMAYFKRVGEISAETDPNFVNNIQRGSNAVRVGIAKSNYFVGDGELNNTYVDQNFVSAPIPSANERAERRERSTSFLTLTAKEADKVNILPILNHKYNDFTWNNKTADFRSPNASATDAGYSSTVIGREEGGRKGHHISEVRVTDNSGARYVYGIPAYNTYQEEVTFSVNAGGQSNVQTGLIDYEKNVDDTKDNAKGLDNYYNKVVTPGYAHSYLLTTVLSADYVDRDNIPGPSDGDLGTYTKFNYVRVMEKFKWRTPFSLKGGEGSYSQGMISKDSDDKANYVYGEKEVWYLHSIETRTHVAEFHLKDREDARGVVDRHGKIGSEKQKCIDKIVLYSKPDKLNSAAEPIKTVHFDYDYSLCPNTPNSEGGANHGKLTLKKVWFTYGNSQKGVLNPYIFNYADQNFDGQMDAELNPTYDFKNYDRWGNYKKDNTSGLSNAEFPYSTQDKDEADKNSAVYALSGIQTPTGGNLRVYYESDDYAYVQNRRAMRMFNVLGCSHDVLNNNGNSELFDFGGQKPYLTIDLVDGFKPSGDKNLDFRDKYLSGIEVMFYKFLTTVLVDQNRKEFISGYARINKDQSYVIGTPDANGYYHKAKIKLEYENAGGLAGDVNPVTKAGWMFARMRMSRELMGSADATDGGLEQVLRSLLSSLEAVTRLFTGFSGKMLAEGNSKVFQPSKSFVRLNEPDKIKVGGGHRVKAVVMVDNWGLMKSQKELSQSINTKQTSFYGQKYDYTFKENGKIISAGVASYEPSMGGEENPFKMPVPQKEKVPLAPDKEFYLEEPFGESFFPAPSVGYRKVVVTPIKVVGEYVNVNNLPGNGTGFVEHEFYTALEFPTITRQTKVDIKRHKPNMLLKFMKFDSRDLLTCTQGYYVELNDMHGKQKSNRVYPELTAAALSSGTLPTPISEVEYTYKTNSDGSLSNKVTYVNPDLSIDRTGNKEMGVDEDMVEDQRYFESTTLGGGLQFNLKYVQAAVVPLFIPTAFPDFNSEQTRFRSVVITKVVNKYSILETTTARDNGAAITTKNLAYDAKTGQVLLTETQNEFHDPIYSFTYPGHWSYERMGLAAANEGLAFGSLSSVLSSLKDGDEVLINSSDKVVYVVDNNGVKSLINKKGDAVTLSANSKLRVIRSGARNSATTPVGSIVTLESPIKAGNTSLVFNKVLNAGVNEYKEDWQRFCNCPDFENDPNKTKNPFMLGRRGNIRPLRNWTYLTNRTQTLTNNNLSVRNDGIFADFVPFWAYNTVSGKSYLYPLPTLSSTKWQFITQIEKYNTVGMAIEEQDALHRFSTALYGYGRNLQSAGSNNSQYRETGFDGFEDYDFGDCEDDHMSWRTFKTNVTNTESHTGKKSIKVSQNQSLKINKVIIPCDIDSVMTNQ